MEKSEILKKINREIIKSAKKDLYYYYWDVTSLDRYMVGEIVTQLEKEGKKIKNKGDNFKLIMW
jgi:hypothetical protein